MRRWWAGIVRDWHRRKARRLYLMAEALDKERGKLVTEAQEHERREKHWQLEYQRLGGK